MGGGFRIVRTVNPGKRPRFPLHFAKQNFSNPAAAAPFSHRVPLPTNPPLAPAPAGLGDLYKPESGSVGVAEIRSDRISVQCPQRKMFPPEERHEIRASALPGRFQTQTSGD